MIRFVRKRRLRIDYCLCDSVAFEIEVTARISDVDKKKDVVKPLKIRFNKKKIQKNYKQTEKICII